jgi:hypothetical protein
VVFIIDEAHLLAPDQLEELRLLTNAEMDSQSPFALLLVGQPTLARQLRLGVFAALDQRIATRYQLAPMDLAESAQYLRHHLALVGRTDPLVACHRSTAQGQPRLATCPEQRRHRRSHCCRHRRQGLGRRRLRKESRRRIDARLMLLGSVAAPQVSRRAGFTQVVPRLSAPTWRTSIPPQLISPRSGLRQAPGRVTCDCDAQ